MLQIQHVQGMASHAITYMHTLKPLPYSDELLQIEYVQGMASHIITYIHTYIKATNLQ
jgi:hypothetical protein